MPEPPEPEGGRVLSEAEQEELKRIEDARASLEELLEHERERRRNRWVFFGALFVGGLILFPFFVLYVALVIHMAASAV